MARLCIFCLQIFDLQTVKNNQQPAHATSGIPVSIIKGLIFKCLRLQTLKTINFKRNY